MKLEKVKFEKNPVTLQLKADSDILLVFFIHFNDL